MATAKFFATCNVYVEIDEAVFAVVDAEWCKRFYELSSRAEIADHVTYNVLQGRRLSTLDGFAELQDDMVSIERVEIDSEEEVS